MKEYHKCKRCYSHVPVKKMAKHHIKVHPDVPHQQYLDKFFDLDRPLLKCNFCSTKLLEKRMTVHLQRAHLVNDYSHKPKPLVAPAMRASDELIQISSDSDSDMDVEDEEEEGEIIEEPIQKVDVAVQCDVESKVASTQVDIKMANKSVGVHYETKVAAVNTEQLKSVNFGTQTDMPQIPEKPMNMSLERDDDGWIELVFQ